MHPMDLKKKWKLTYSQLASLLGYNSEFTVRSWNMPGKRRRNPKKIVLIACDLINEKWEKEGKIPGFMRLKSESHLENQPV